MKKVFIAILAFSVLATGVIFAVAQKSDDGGKGSHGRRGGHHRSGGMGFRGIDLTEAQKTQIKSIREANKAAVQPLREAMKANRAKMAELTANGAFDEAQITALANETAAVQAKLTVERQRVKSQMFTVLTEEQKAKMAEIKAKRGERKKGRRGPKAEKVSE